MAIQLPDARLLSDEVLQALRLRALRARERGLSETDIADLLGVRRETVCRWWNAYCQGGTDALPGERLGRPPGAGRMLSFAQEHYIQALLDHYSPPQLDIPSPLWTRRAVTDLIHQQLGIRLAIRTVGEYLRRWGYTPQRPARKARGQNPEEVRRWLEEEYPALVERAAAEGAEIYWADELGVGIDEYRGRGYARPGATPQKEVAARRTRVNAVSAISNQGEGHFLTFTGSLDAAVFIVFLSGLLAATTRKVIVVLDRLRVHGSAEVAAWVAAQGGRVELVPLPRYAPERNPAEYLNNDAKAEVNAAGLPKDQEELQSNLNAFLHKLCFWPERIISYFCHPAVHYAAANMV